MHIDKLGIPTNLNTAIRENSLLSCGLESSSDESFIAKWPSLAHVPTNYHTGTCSRPRRHLSPAIDEHTLGVNVGSLLNTYCTSIVFYHRVDGGIFNGKFIFFFSFVIVYSILTYSVEGFVFVDPRHHSKFEERLIPGPSSHDVVSESKFQLHVEFSETISRLSFYGSPIEISNRIKLFILEYVIGEMLPVISRICSSLSLIQEDLLVDRLVQKHQHAYRVFLNEWSQECFEMKASLAYMREAVQFNRTSRSLAGKVRRIQGLLDSIVDRIGGLQQTLMSTMSIIDSKEAINEARNVGKLTQLAFFFIPDVCCRYLRYEHNRTYFFEIEACM